MVYHVHAVTVLLHLSLLLTKCTSGYNLPPPPPYLDLDILHHTQDMYSPYTPMLYNQYTLPNTRKIMLALLEDFRKLELASQDKVNYGWRIEVRLLAHKYQL